MFLLFLFSQLSLAARPVEVRLLYEAYCGYSQRFILKQLDPAVRQIGDIMNITLIPFGNARVYDGGVTCQHGEDECEAMMWSNCAIKLYPDFAQHWPFIYCQMNEDQRENAEIGKCAEEAALNYTQLEECFENDGKDLLIAAGNKNTKHPGVPYVFIGETADQQAINNFEWEVCRAYTGNPPKGCFYATESPSHTVSMTPNGNKLLKQIGYLW